MLANKPAGKKIKDDFFTSNPKFASGEVGGVGYVQGSTTTSTQSDNVITTGIAGGNTTGLTGEEGGNTTELPGKEGPTPAPLEGFCLSQISFRVSLIISESVFLGGFIPFVNTELIPTTTMPTTTGLVMRPP